MLRIAGNKRACHKWPFAEKADNVQTSQCHMSQQGHRRVVFVCAGICRLITELSVFSMCLSEDSLQNERQKSQLMQERKPGAGWRAADWNGLILLPHTPGAKNVCLRRLG